MVEFKKLVTTLPSGSNSYTFTDALINDNSVIEVYTNDDDVYPINTTQSGNSVSVELSTHSDDVELCITINNVEEYSPVDISGLEDEIEGLSDIVNDISDNINNIEGDISTLGGMVTDLETSKQDTLTPGENISIVNNVISASGGSSNNYSTNEQIVGTWIDGKPLYQKTINYNADGITGSYDIPHNISDLKRIVDMSGFFFSSPNNVYVPLNFAHPTAPMSPCGTFVSQSNISFRIGSAWNFNNVIITLRYTKVGD